MTIYLQKNLNTEDIYQAFSKIKGVLITTSRDGHVIRLYKTPIKPINIEGDSAVKELEICVSSMESEDKRILHKLYSLVRISE